MRLIELKPRWITLQNWVSTEKFYIGLSFLCPHCPPESAEHGGVRRRRLAVSFWPPIDPTNMLGRVFDLPVNQQAHRRESGDTFDTLTIEPSIGFESISHWHGRITNGNCV